MLFKVGLAHGDDIPWLKQIGLRTQHRHPVQSVLRDRLDRRSHLKFPLSKPPLSIYRVTCRHHHRPNPETLDGDRYRCAVN